MTHPLFRTLIASQGDTSPSSAVNSLSFPNNSSGAVEEESLSHSVSSGEIRRSKSDSQNLKFNGFLSKSGSGLRTALEFLDVQDYGVRDNIARSLASLLDDLKDEELHTVSPSSIDEEDFGFDAPAVNETRGKDLDAIKTLALSSSPQLRKMAGELLNDLTALKEFPPGSMSLKTLLMKATDLARENEDSDRCAIVCFCLRVTLSIASKGPVWAERVAQSGWSHILVELLLKLVLENSTITLNDFDLKRPSLKYKNDSFREDDLLLLSRRGSRDVTGYRNGRKTPESPTKRVEKLDFDNESLLTIKGIQRLEIKLCLKLIAMLGLSEQPEIFEKQIMNLIELLCFVCGRLSISTDATIIGLSTDALLSLVSSKNVKGEMLEDMVIPMMLFKAAETTPEVSRLTRRIGELIPDDFKHFNVFENSDKTEILKKTRSFSKSPEDVSATVGESFHLTRLCVKLLSCALVCIESKPEFLASKTCEMFSEFNVMNTLNCLYNSQFRGTRVIVSQFLYALCKNIDEKHKLLLCESGIIMRLLRLASPTSVDVAEEECFVPAILSIAELAKVEIISARIVVAGALGPLYAHAHSSRSTRAAAKKALDVLQITDVNDIINWYVERVRESKKKSPQPNRLSQYLEVAQRTQHREDAELSLNAYLQMGTSTSEVQRRLVRNLSEEQRKQIPVVLPQRIESFFGGTEVFDKNHMIGRGAFSTVFRAYLKKKRYASSEEIHRSSIDEGNAGNFKKAIVEEVALKKLTTAAVSDEGFVNEIRILSKISGHRNICKFLGFCFFETGEAEPSVVLVSEYCGDQTLSDALKSRTSSIAYDWLIRLGILLQVSQALRFLHSLNPAVLHLDIKASNILVSVGNSFETKKSSRYRKMGRRISLSNCPFVAKLCDFGLATELKPGYEFLSPRNKGTLQWMAPEVMADDEYDFGKGFDKGADVFSFAVLLWEVGNPGRVPWDEVQAQGEKVLEERIRDLVVSGRRVATENTESWPVGYEWLMRQCWRQDSSERLSFVSSFLSDPDSESRSVNPVSGGLQVDLGDSIPVILQKIVSYAHQYELERELSRRFDND